MALLNNLYVFVTDEDVSYNVTVTEHTVETGIEISDHVKRKGITLSISGEIVGMNAANILSKIKQIHQSGTICSYSGRNALSNCLITEFSTGHPNTIWGGCEFSMTLKEIRTASTSYKKTKTAQKTGTQQKVAKSTTEYVYHTVKKGDTVWALVAAPKAPYKSLSRPAIDGKTYSACNWVMAQNPSAFSRKGDFGTLQIGKKIIVGVRKGTGTGTGGTGTGTGGTGTGTGAKKYTVTVNVIGASQYVKSVVIAYIKDGKRRENTKTNAGSMVISADAGTLIRVKATARTGGKFSIIAPTGGPWTGTKSTTPGINKLSKNSAIKFRFSKKT